MKHINRFLKRIILSDILSFSSRIPSQCTFLSDCYHFTAEQRLLSLVNFDDLIWSVAINPSQSVVAIGTTGTTRHPTVKVSYPNGSGAVKQLPAVEQGNLRLYDFEKGWNEILHIANDLRSLRGMKKKSYSLFCPYLLKIYSDVFFL